MKKLKLETEMDFETFVKGMDKGYSGGGDSITFTFTKFNGKAASFSVSQDLMLAYNNFNYARHILTNTLKKEK